MRRLCLMFAVLLVVSLLGSDSPKEHSDKTEPVGMEGAWRQTEVESNGQKTKLSYQEVTTYHRGTFTSNSGDDGDLYHGSYRIDPTRKPPHLDRIPSIGPTQVKTAKCIYQIDGDTLRIAYMRCPNDSLRPQGFNDKGVVVEIYKRVK